MLPWPKMYINIHKTLCNITKYPTIIQWASLKQTRGCGSLCWCYHSNTMATICCLIMQTNSSDHHRRKEWRGIWRILFMTGEWCPSVFKWTCWYSRQEEFRHFCRSAHRCVRFHSTMTKLRGWAMICKSALILPTNNTKATSSIQTLETPASCSHGTNFIHSLSKERSLERQCPCDLLMCFPQVKTEKRRLH